MLLTTEQVKRRILDHLEEQAANWDESDVRPFAYEALADIITGCSTKVLDKALEDLEEEENVVKSHIRMDLYLPATASGRRIKRNLAAGGHGLGSWPGSIFWAFVLVYTTLNTYPALLSYPSSDQTTMEAAYRDGAITGLFWAAVPGMVLAWGIHRAWSAYQRSSLMNESLHRRIVWTTKVSLILSSPDWRSNGRTDPRAGALAEARRVE